MEPHDSTSPAATKAEDSKKESEVGLSLMDRQFETLDTGGENTVSEAVLKGADFSDFEYELTECSTDVHLDQIVAQCRLENL